MKKEQKKQKMTGDLYICHTVYHFLVALARWQEGGPVTFWLSTTISNAQQLAYQIRQSGAPVRVLVKDKDVLRSEFGFYPRPLLAEMRAFLQSFAHIYLFNDDTPEGFFCHRQKLAYVLLEDGYNYFTIAHQQGYPRSLKERLARQVKRRPLIRGYSSACQAIEINSWENLAVSQTDSRYAKLCVLPRKALFRQLSSEKESYMQAIFGPVPEVNERGRLALVLTQPLAQDGLMSPSQQAYFYEKVITRLQASGYQVLLKGHPRDHLTYDGIKGVTCLAQAVPVEYLALQGKLQLSLVVSHSSTANQFFEAPTVSQVFYDWARDSYDAQLLGDYGLDEGDIR
ncbi:glycosyltransferase family 52 [Streptococcus sp. DD12]|uniref:glycosyltransferase family 52 n=1 Tax=Streptococcus sp. DD12 TaxID=1777880 RepID=UPI00079BDB89|nr:glycosyltransferase family 52 [Streptococcus sp. DD12]KXT76177.1 Capsular polysaccharide biosynthesis protein CpsK(V) [Streptococcus sp. DD12]